MSLTSAPSNLRPVFTDRKTPTLVKEKGADNAFFPSAAPRSPLNSSSSSTAASNFVMKGMQMSDATDASLLNTTTSLPMNTKVLVTGAAGFIGSQLCKALRGRGYYVIGADIQLPDSEYGRAQDICNEFHLADLRDERTCVELAASAGVIYHLAADLGGKGYEPADQQTMLMNNQEMTRNIALAAGNTKRVVYTSSNCVSSSDSGTDSSSNNNNNSSSIYSWEKQAAEKMLAAALPIKNLRIARLGDVQRSAQPDSGSPSIRQSSPLPRSPIGAIDGFSFTSGSPDTNSTSTTSSTGTSTKRSRAPMSIDECVQSLIGLGLNDSIMSSDMMSQQQQQQQQSQQSQLQQQQQQYPLTVNIGSSVDSTMANLAKIFRWGNQQSGLDSWRSSGKMANNWPRVSDDASTASVAATTNSANAMSTNVASAAAPEQQQQQQPVVSFGVLLPITSRGSTAVQFWHRLTSFASHLTAASRGDPFWPTMRIFVGLDDDDALVGLDKPEERNRLLSFLRTNCCWRSGLSATTTRDPIQVVSLSGKQFRRGAICQYWSYLAGVASRAGCTHYVLSGDDVEIKSRRWMSAFYRAFDDLAIEINAPPGFGCVAFKDSGTPGFPTFPVLTRTHMEIFDGQFLPEAFVIQDGDPYLFNLYRRWGAAKIIETATMINTVGGEGTPRYEVVHTDWTGKVLDNSVAKVQSWLERQQGDNVTKVPHRKLMLDILVPTYRCILPLLKGILDLKAPPEFNCDLGFIVVVDRAIDEKKDREFYEVWKALNEEYGERPNYRIRSQGKNTGPSEARNRCLQESSADYILWLDDDVKPGEDIIRAYLQAIRDHPDAPGFAGPTFLPKTNSTRCLGARLAGIINFWDMPNRAPTVPWAVTANVMFKRNALIKFETRLPKTGGGEDIDYCIKACNGTLVSVPDAKAVHPWWNNGWPDLYRFYNWARGDGALAQFWPQYSFTSLPNLSEAVFVGMSFLLMMMPYLMWSATANALNRPMDFFMTLTTFMVRCLLIVGSAALADLAHEAYEQLWNRPERHNDEAFGWLRVQTVWQSWLARTATEMGRVEGLLQRRQPQLVGRRFDMFVGKNPAAIRDELKMAATRWGFWCAAVAITVAATAGTAVGLF